MTTSAHVRGGLAPPTVVFAPPWAPPVVVALADWPAPHVWPAPCIWPAPVMTRSPWPAPAPVLLARSRWPAPALEADVPPIDISDTPNYRHARPAMGRGRSLAYTLAGVAAAVVGFAVVVIR